MKQEDTIFTTLIDELTSYPYDLEKDEAVKLIEENAKEISSM